MPPGGDPAFLIFGSFDQAKERTKKTDLMKISPYGRNDKKGNDKKVYIEGLNTATGAFFKAKLNASKKRSA